MALAIDQLVSADDTLDAGTKTTAAFTTAADVVLFAFVSGYTTALTVTSPGLEWVLVRRTAVQEGTAEIWRAQSASPLVNHTVTVTDNVSQLKGNVTITVVSLTGADMTGPSGSAAVGSTGTGNSTTGAPTASLTTTRNNSWVWGVGFDFDNNTSHTVGTSQTMVHQYLDGSDLVANWVQRQTSTTPTSGTVVAINDTAPTTERWNLSSVEILPAVAVTPGTIVSGGLMGALGITYTAVTAVPYTAHHTTDTNKKVSGTTKNHSTSSVIRKSFTAPFTTNSVLRTQPTVAHTTDALKRKVVTVSHTTSTNKKQSYSLFHITSANKKIAGITKFHSTDSAKRRTVTIYHTTDANTKKTGLILNHTTSSNKKKSYIVSHTTSANKKTSGLLVSHTTSSNKKKSGLTVFHTTSANKKISGITAAHTTDSLKRKQFSVSHSTSSNKRTPVTLAHSTDSLKHVTSTLSHTADANKKLSTNVSHTTSSNKRKVSTVFHTTSANKKLSGLTISHTTSANKKKSSLSVLHTTDANKKISGLTRSHTTDALKRKQPVISHATDALKRRTVTASHSTDALKRVARTLSHSTDVNKKLTSAISHTTNSNKRKAFTVAHTTSANTKKTGTLSHTTSANKRLSSAIFHTTSANKKISGVLLTHTTDSNKKKATLLSHTTSSVVRKAFNLSHLTSANKRITGLTRSHTTSANKRVSGLTRLHTTDVVKRKTSTLSHTSDAAVLLARRLNLITNPSFEIDATGYGEYHNPGSIFTTYGIDTTTAWVGTQSLKITTGASGNAYAGVYRNVGNLIVGQTYTISCYVKGNVGGENFNIYPSTTGQVDITLTTDWQRFSESFVAVSTNHTLYFRSATPSATFWLDGVLLERANQPVRNYNFETQPPFVAAQNTTGWMDGTLNGGVANTGYDWYAGLSGGATARFDTSDSHTGAGSLKVSTTNGGVAEVRNNATGYNNGPVPLIPGYSYTVTYWMKTNYISGDSNHGANVCFLGVTDAGANTTNHNIGYIKTTTPWTQYSFSFTAGVNEAGGGHFEARIYAHTGTGNLAIDVWFDDINIVQNTLTDNYFDGDSSGAGWRGSPHASVSYTNVYRLSRTHTTSAVKRKTNALTHTTDSYTRLGSGVVSHTTDTLKRTTVNLSHSTSSNKRKAFTVSHTTSANKRITGITRSHTTDANKRKQFILSHSTSTNKRVSGILLAHTTDALKRQQLVRTHTTDTVKRTRSVVSHTTSSNKRQSFLRTHTTDAQILSAKRFNFFPNPSVETDLSNWTTYAATIARDTTQSFYGTASVKLVSTGADGGGYTPTISFLPDQTYTLQARIKGTPGDQVRFQNNQGGSVYSNYFTLTGGWDFCTWTFPSRTTNGGVGSIEFKALNSGQTFYVDGVQLEYGSVATPYFDGNSPHSFWRGTTNSSQSYSLSNVYLPSHTTSSVLRFGSVPVSHTTDAIKRTSVSSSHTTSAVLRKQYSSTHFTDTVKRKTATLTHTTDSNKRVAGTVITHTSDSLKRRAYTVLHTTNSNKRRVNSISHFVDANKRRSYIASHTTSSNKRLAGITRSHTTNANKRKLTTIAHLTDANKRRSYSVSHTTNVLLRNTYTLSHTTDAQILKARRINRILNPSFENGLNNWQAEVPTDLTVDTTTGVTDRTSAGKFVSDGHWRNFKQQGTISVIAGQKYSVQARVTTLVPHTANPSFSNQTHTVIYAYWQNASGGTFAEGSLSSNTDLAIVRTKFLMSGTVTAPAGAVSVTFNIYQYGVGTAWYDSLLFEQSDTVNNYFDGNRVNAAWRETADNSESYTNVFELTKTHSTDTVKRKTTTPSHTTNALKRGAYTISHTTNAFKRRTVSLTHTTSTNKKIANNVRSHSTDVLKKRAGVLLTHTTDLLLRKQTVLTHSTDALKRTVNVLSHTTDASIRRGDAGWHTTDSNKRRSYVVSHATSSNKRKPSTVSHSTNSILRRAVSASHTTDSIIRKGNVVFHTSSANRRKAAVLTHTTSANKRKVTTVFHTTSANKRAANIFVSHLTSANKRRAYSVLHVTDVLKRTTSTRSHTTSSLIRRATALSHSTSSVLRRAVALTHTTDVTIRQGNAVYFTTSSNKRVAFIARTHNTDSLLRKQSIITHTTGAVKRAAIVASHTTNALKRVGNTRSHTTDALMVYARRINLVSNPSLETDLTDIGTHPNLTMTRDTTTSVFGSASLKVQDANVGGKYFLVNANNWEVGKTYVFSAYIKQTVTGRTGIGIRAFGDAGIISTSTTDIVGTVSNWTRYSSTLTIPAGTTSVQWILIQDNTVGAFTAWYDGFMVEEAKVQPFNENFDNVPPQNSGIPTTNGNYVITGHGNDTPNTNGAALARYRWMINIYQTTAPYGAMYDTSVKHGGAASLKMIGTDVQERVNFTLGKRNYGDLNVPEDIRSNLIPVDPNVTYTFGMWYKIDVTNVVGTPHTTNAMIWLAEHSFTGYTGGTNLYRPDTVTKDWTYAEVTFTTGANTRFLNVFGGMTGYYPNYWSGTLWVDDFTLKPTASANVQPTAYFDGSLPHADYRTVNGSIQSYSTSWVPYIYHTTNTVLRKQVARTHSTSSVLRRAVAISHTTSSVKRSGLTVSHSTSANKKSSYIVSQTVSANKRKVYTTSHSTNSVLRKASLVQHTTSTVKRAASLVSHTTDLLKRRAFTVLHTTSANKRKAANVITHSTSAFLRTANMTLHNTDALKRKATVVYHTADALKYRAFHHFLMNMSPYMYYRMSDTLPTAIDDTGNTTGTYAGAITINNNGYYLKNEATPYATSTGVSGNRLSVANNAAIRNIGNNNSYSVIAIFRSTVKKDQSISEKWDSNGVAGTLDKYPWALRGPNPSGGIAMAIYDGTNNPGAGTSRSVADGDWHIVIGVRDYEGDVVRFYLDGVRTGQVTDTTTGNVSTDRSVSIMARNLTGQNFTGDVALFAVVPGAIDDTTAATIHSLARNTASITHTTDVIKRKAAPITHTTSANKRKSTLATHRTDTSKKVVTRVSHTTSSVIRVTTSVYHSTSSYIRKRYQSSHSTSSNLKKAYLSQHTTSVYLRKVTSASHTTSAVKRTYNVLSHATSSVIRGAYQVSHTTNGLIRNSRFVAHQTDALLHKTTAISHTTSLSLKKIGRIVYTTSTSLRKSNRIVHTTDSSLWSYRGTKKVLVGRQWVYGTVEVLVDGEWVVAPVNIYTGTDWVLTEQ